MFRLHVKHRESWYYNVREATIRFVEELRRAPSYAFRFRFAVHERPLTSQRARIVSVVLYALTVVLGSIILGCFYTWNWHPSPQTLSRIANLTLK